MRMMPFLYLCLLGMWSALGMIGDASATTTKPKFLKDLTNKLPTLKELSKTVTKQQKSQAKYASDASRFKLPNNNFLERSYIGFRFTPTEREKAAKLGLVFEAEPTLHLHILDLFPRLQKKENIFAFSISFSMLLQLRMLSGESAPVYAPSYEPRGNIQLFWLKRFGYKAKPSRALLFGVRGSFGHHSNGQDYCLFTDKPYNKEEDGILDRNTKDGKSACPAPKAMDADIAKKLNWKYGSFSIHYVELDFNVKYMAFNGYGEEVRSYVGGLSVQYHPDFFGAGSNIGIQKQLFGTAFVTLRFEYERQYNLNEFGAKYLQWLYKGSWPDWLSGRWRATLEATMSLGQASNPHVPFYKASLEISYTFDVLGGFGFYLRGYSGRDYYNALFVDWILLQVVGGITFDTRSPVKIF